MSIEIIKDQISQFVGSKNPEVMAIKGGWGVGKTFTWNKFLLEAQKENRISLDKYSYISLFGINSLEAFKFSIFENVVNRELIGTEASIETFKTNASNLLETTGRKWFGKVIGTTMLKGFNPLIESLSFLSLNNTLICIDDLERKGKNLSIKDVLGLISLLKEQKKCKVVILLNDGDDDLEEYSKYREKVIDCELKFHLKTQECTSIAFIKGDLDYDKLSNFCNKLDIRNIRVLKKIERLFELSIPLLKPYEEEITHQVIHGLTLYSWCHYCSNDKSIPSLDYVLKRGYDIYGIGDDKDETDEEKNWKLILHEYDYQATDDFDLIIAEAVKSGYFIETDFRREAEKKNKEVIAFKTEGSFTQAWRLYHDSFDDNSDAVVNGIHKSFKDSLQHITLTNLNGTVTLFRELGHDDKATEIINLYMEKRIKETDLFNLEENDTFGDVRDSEIVDKFNEFYKESVISENVKQVLDRISGKGGWDTSDEIVLANTTVDEYFNLFKNEKGRHLSSYIKACLKFGKFGNSTEQQKLIASNATKALQRIALESEINKRRVRKFGIKVNDA